MSTSEKSARCSIVFAGAFIALSGPNAYADGNLTVASDNVYERNARWLIVMDGKGTGCGLAVPFAKGEIIQVVLENKSNILTANFVYLKTGLNVPLSGNYELNLKFDDGSAFSQHAEAYNDDVYSGYIAKIFYFDLLEKLSRTKMLNLKVGEVSFGNFDLTFFKAGIPRLYECMIDTTKWDVTSSLNLRQQLRP